MMQMRLRCYTAKSNPGSRFTPPVCITAVWFGMRTHGHYTKDTVFVCVLFVFVLFCLCVFFKRLKLIINKNMFKSFLAELPIKN